jgi:hypothetical protein
MRGEAVMHRRVNQQKYQNNLTNRRAHFFGPTAPNKNKILAREPAQSVPVYEVRPRKDHRGVDLISDVLPFGRLWYTEISNAIGYAMHSGR